MILQRCFALKRKGWGMTLFRGGMLVTVLMFVAVIVVVAFIVVVVLIWLGVDIEGKGPLLVTMLRL